MIDELSQVPPTVSELFVRIARGRTDLEEIVVKLSEAQLTAPRKDGWSVKDHLMHLAAWEAGIAALLRGESRYAAMGVDLGSLASDDFNAINQQIFEQNQSRSLKDARGHFHNVHMDLLNELAKLSDADLMKPYSHFQPNDKDADTSAPILGWIVGNTYGHYAEHIEWIREMLK